MATKLGESGANVLMIDKASFPSSTLSTHFFRAGRAITVLNELGVLPEVLALDPPQLIQWYMYLNNAVTAVPNPIEPTGEIEFDLSVRREPLDDILVRRAKRCENVRFLEKTVLKDLIWDNGRVAGVRLLNEQGEQTVHARLVIGADGRNSTVARFVNTSYEKYDRGWRGIYYCYVKGWVGPNGAPPDAMEASQLEDEIAYVFPSDHSFTCLAISVNREGFA
jgi:2-polyprenyl-6-methoxyphenol hydroxylase-like FAD-dependent oxidoreductase